jgi:hypothetical protein
MYDCVYAYLDVSFFEEFYKKWHIQRHHPSEQISAFCLVVKQSIMFEQFCYPYNETGWSFEQLREKDIKSSDLARWKAPVNTIDEYERFLQTATNELSTFHSKYVV